MSEPRRPTQRIVFTDAGIDDAFALVLLHHVTQTGADYIVCDGGNVHAEYVANNCSFLKRTFGFKSRLFLGSDPPGITLRDATDVHGPYGLARYRPASCIVSSWGALISELESGEAGLDVAVLGPCTDPARLLDEPQIRPRIERFVVMGGAFEPREGRLGNITEHAEFNVYMDPEAAWRIMDSSVPSVWVPLDATEKRLYTQSEMLAGVHGSTRGNLLTELFRFCADAHRRLGSGRGVFMHDALAIAFWLDLIDADLSSTRATGIPAEGDERGRIIHGPDEDGGIEVQYAVSVDHADFLRRWRHIVRSLR